MYKILLIETGEYVYEPKGRRQKRGLLLYSREEVLVEYSGDFEVAIFKTKKEINEIFNVKKNHQFVVVCKKSVPLNKENRALFEIVKV